MTYELPNLTFVGLAAELVQSPEVAPPDNLGDAAPGETEELFIGMDD